MMINTSDWKERCARRKELQTASIPKDWIIELPPETQTNVLDVPRTCGLLTPRELEITETLDVGVILDQLHSAAWSSVEVTTAFYKRAIVAHQLTNCLTEIFIREALMRAALLDEILRTTGKIAGPLHGLPISLKDQFTMKGLETIMGYVAWIGDVADDDCILVQILCEAGAVPFVRTNVPQALMWGETYNHVFGRTTNPYNRMLTPGGSSGGEGALLAMKGSPLGVGTDIGGSVRIPSAFCGLYTLRPSYHRLPYYGLATPLKGQESVPSVTGPMASTLSGVKILTKAIIDACPWDKDPMTLRKDWSESEYRLSRHGEGKTPLCFAIMWDNGIVKPHPPIRRALMLVKAALEALGHRVIDWTPHRHLEIYKNIETIFDSDGGQDYEAPCKLSGEPFLRTMIPGADPEAEPSYVPYVRTLIGPSINRTTQELWKLHDEKQHLRKSYLDHWAATISQTGTGRPVDAILSPALAYTAVPHGAFSDLFYTSLCNAMDFACTGFPVTHVDAELDHPSPPHDFYNYEDKAIYELYDPQIFHGSPVGLQLIGRPQEEEGVLAMTEIVDDALRRQSTAL